MIHPITCLIPLMFFSSAFPTFAGPWTDTSRFEIEANTASDDYWRGNFPMIRKEYEKRFGAFPNYMLWKDTQQPKTIEWGIFYTTDRKEFEEKKPWIKPLEWKDIEGYFYWKLVNFKTGHITYLKATTSNKNKNLNYEDYYTICWGTELSIDAWELPLDDNIAYYISPEVWEGTPENGKLIASPGYSVTVVKANHETPLDDYMDAYWYSDFEDDPDLTIRLLNDFPFDTIMLQRIYARYWKIRQADSLKWAASQWIYSLENKLDDHYQYIEIGSHQPPCSTGVIRVIDGPMEMTPERREMILRGVMEVCGDTLLPPPWRTK